MTMRRASTILVRSTQAYLHNRLKDYLSGVLEMRKGHVDQARAFFQTAASLAPHMFECHYNYSTLAEKTGDLQTSYVLVQKSLTNFPQHADSNDLLLQLGKHFQHL